MAKTEHNVIYQYSYLAYKLFPGSITKFFNIFIYIVLFYKINFYLIIFNLLNFNLNYIKAIILACFIYINNRIYKIYMIK